MESETSEKVVLTVMESMLKAGLRSVREQLSSMGREEKAATRKERKSNIKLVADILREAGRPLHIDEIIRIAGEARGVELHCESIVSALSKKLLEGKVFRIGTPEFNITFVRGTLMVTVGRENTEAVFETNNGDSVGNRSGSFRGLITARFRTGPQITGYLKDLSKRNPEAAMEYVKSMPKLNKAQWDVKQEQPVEAPSIQEVSQKTQEIINPFDCNGDCDLQDLWKNNSIAH